MVKKVVKGVALKLPPTAQASRKRKRGSSAGGGIGSDRGAQGGDSQRDRGGPKGAGKTGGKRGGDSKKSGGKGQGKGKRQGQSPAEGQDDGERKQSRSALRSKLKKQRDKEEKKLPKKKRKRLERRKKLKDKEWAAKNPEAAEEAAKKAAQQPKAKKKLKASEVVDAMCKRGHTMLKRSDNPAGYNNPAACDKCGNPNLPKKVLYFYHCSFCKWDICPDCILEWRMRGTRAPKHIREQLKEEREGGDGKHAKKAKKQEDARLGKEMNEREFNKDRREIWLPTDATAINRAPTAIEVVSDWVEGVPL